MKKINTELMNSATQYIIEQRVNQLALHYGLDLEFQAMFNPEVERHLSNLMLTFPAFKVSIKKELKKYSTNKKSA